MEKNRDIPRDIFIHYSFLLPYYTVVSVPKTWKENKTKNWTEQNKTKKQKKTKEILIQIDKKLLTNFKIESWGENVHGNMNFCLLY